ncbi:oligosaccharide flippase family protein [Leptolyngbya sp. 7M]|uniref:oligosaccharide flippase family protein n=1 Tax=Leptolyngbya sp. 7M TaxID=2812896 RepID=UPI001B8D7A07|nr:oligosaccharide flippase family protein [Leptolyngbya sp. 7M]QYO62532.1 oligosaccharide flippase family protein [Leptolyngbya sp. 7M]
MSSSQSSQSSIKKLAIRGTVWTVLSYGASQIIRFGNNLILTRLLVPELFGLVTLGQVFITGLHLFSDVGLGVSVIQSKRGDEPVFLNTAWTIQVIRGGAIWLGCLLLAYPVAQAYNEPRLLWLIPVLGLNTVISGFNSSSLFTLNRHLAIKQLAIYELTGQVIASVVMITWAWFSPTVWALAVGGLAASIFQIIWSYRLNHWKLNTFTWNRVIVKEILTFGVWIFLSTAMTFLAEQADRLILGKLLTLELLGIYGIALTFADIPRAVTMAVSGKVIMPAVAKIADLPRFEIRAKLLKARRWVLIGLAASVAGLAAFGDLIIKTLYDQRYVQAAWMLPILAIGIWPRLLCNTNEPALFAIGKPQYTAAANLSRFLCTAVGIFIGYALFGLPGAVVGVALNDLFYYFVVNYGLWREGLGGVRQDILSTLLLMVILAAFVAVRYSLGFGVSI